jgi:thioredoxin reductase
VTMSYRKGEFDRLTPKNKTALNDLSNAGAIHIMLNSEVQRFDEDQASFIVKGQPLDRKFDEFFILIGYELPLELLKNIGVELKDL